MKILAIRGKNLASLEKEFEVDFTVEPLKSAGIFAITGSTGSGKTTLLDTLCIALFDTSPRMKNASEKIFLCDVGDDTILQGDSRTILRRGATDGFAEADFISLGGDTYRARWTVQRANNKTNGTLQKSKIVLYNLTADREEQGTKTDLLKKITELIGLSFDQFARSVLLAQGDFAAFLKAKHAEKAELLEKLTGTNIYSQISIQIFEKSKDAETKLNLLNERFKSIELYKDEQITAFETEKKSIQQALSFLKKEAEALSLQLKWIDEKNRLSDQMKLAEIVYVSTQQAIETASKRFEYIAQLEAAQSIRDTVGLLKNVQKQLSESKINLLSAQNERERNHAKLVEAQKSLAQYEKEQVDLQELHKEIAPQIITARALDIQIKAAKTVMEDAQKDFSAAKTTHDKTNKNLSDLRIGYAQAEQTLSTLNQWFERNIQYENIVPRTELLINLVTDTQTSNLQREQNEKMLVSNRSVLDEKLKQLEKLKQETERLNQLLPTEIAVLRDQLIEGLPCLVCGSTNHPMAKTDDVKRMKEQELKKAKVQNAKQAETLTTEIDNRKNEMTRLVALIDNYTTSYEKSLHNMELLLQSVPEWKDLFQRAELADFLKTIAAQWNNNADIFAKTKEQINKLATQIESETIKRKESEENLTAKTERFKHFQSVVVQLSTERANVLHGKPADIAENYFIDKQNLINEQLKKATDAQNTFIAKQESLNGVIIQIQADMKRSAEMQEALQNETDIWLRDRENFTFSLLTELLEKNVAWIQAEKQTLKSLTEAETTAKATLTERRKNLECHHQSDAKPENDAKEIIQASLEEKKAVIGNQTKRITEIETLLLSNEKSNNQRKRLEKELDEKSVIAKNWQKLNKLLGSAKGDKFKMIAQRYTLESLLLYANKHLQAFAPRYKLQSLPDNLGLQVIDTDMLNEVRSVHSLSGGESFLTSLALALGLSSLSSNRMNVESLFIDEGFGSLDSDTLRVAMDALENLRTQGRKIGVISHVVEMTERVAVRIQVRKTSNDKSVIHIDSTCNMNY